MREFLDAYDVFAAPVTQVPAVRRRARVPGGDRRRADGLLPRVVPLLLADHASPRIRRSPCRPGFTRGRAAGRAPARRAARAARRGCCGSRGRSPRRPGSRHGGRSSRCPGRRRRRRPRTARRTPTPSRARSGSRRRAWPRGRAARRGRRPTCASSAAASPGCGRRCTPRRWTRRATSSCSRPRPPGFGASGRNGGFCVASLTHGIENGLARFASEMAVLERLGLENFAGLRVRPGRARHRLRLRADRRAAGADRRLPGAVDRRGARVPGALRPRVTVLDGEAMRAEVHSPTYIGGVWDHTGAGILDPGKLARGLREAALRARGARVRALRRPRPARRPGPVVEALTASGRVRARKVLLATSAYPPLLRSIGRYVVPVYDYVLVSEPLSAAQLLDIGWEHRQGIGDGGNQFHYYRLTADDRDPVRRLGRRLPLPRPGRPALGRARPDVRHALPALLPHLPAARRRALHPPLGRRDRHLLALLGLLRHRVRRPPGLRHRLHRPRRRRRPLRRPHRARPARRPRHRGHPPALRPLQAASPSPRSRCAGRSSSTPATASPPPTATTAAAAPGSACSTPSASASIPSLRVGVGVRGGGRGRAWPRPASPARARRRRR